MDEASNPAPIDWQQGNYKSLLPGNLASPGNSLLTRFFVDAGHGFCFCEACTPAGCVTRQVTSQLGAVFPRAPAVSVVGPTRLLALQQLPNSADAGAANTMNGENPIFYLAYLSLACTHLYESRKHLQRTFCSLQTTTMDI